MLPLAHPKHRGRIFPAKLPVMHNSTHAPVASLKSLS